MRFISTWQSVTTKDKVCCAETNTGSAFFRPENEPSTKKDDSHTLPLVSRELRGSAARHHADPPPPRRGRSPPLLPRTSPHAPSTLPPPAHHRPRLCRRCRAAPQGDGSEEAGRDHRHGAGLRVRKRRRCVLRQAPPRGERDRADWPVRCVQVPHKVRRPDQGVFVGGVHWWEERPAARRLFEVLPG